MASPDRIRRASTLTGVLLIITFVTSIPAQLILYEPALTDSGWVLGEGSGNRIVFGAFLEMVLIAANIGTAVVLFPILRRHSESLALGYVTARTMESVLIALGVVCLLTLVTLKRGDGDDESLVLAGRSLVAVHDWTFLIGPGIVAGLANGLILGYLLYRTGLVPPRFALLGVIGGPIVSASGIAMLFGLYDQISPISLLATLPEFIWELSLGIYLVVKGFRPAVAAGFELPPRSPVAVPTAV